MTALQLHVKKNEGQFPLLEHALEHPFTGISTKSEWLIRGERPNTLFGKFNYMQIFRGRTPEAVLAKIELALEGGRAPHLNYGNHVRYEMAGVRYYLERDPRPDDSIDLVILRDLFCIPEHHQDSGDDWIAEVTVQVRAGA